MFFNKDTTDEIFQQLGKQGFLEQMLNKLANMYKYNIKMTKIPFSIERMKKKYQWEGMWQLFSAIITHNSRTTKAILVVHISCVISDQGSF